MMHSDRYYLQHMLDHARKILALPGSAGHRSYEIEEAVAAGEVIEDYPDDKYRPSCLIMGATTTGRFLHVQASYPPAVKIITVYEPSPEEWEEGFSKRKSHE